jgi:hypothetical protein
MISLDDLGLPESVARIPTALKKPRRNAYARQSSVLRYSIRSARMFLF